MELDEKKLLDLDAFEEAKSNEIFNNWKRSNLQMENEIERFMAERKAHIHEIMERSDKLRCHDGFVITDRDVQTQVDTKSPDSDEIRLLREQNELLKQLLSKQLR